MWDQQVFWRDYLLRRGSPDPPRLSVRGVNGQQAQQDGLFKLTQLKAQSDAVREQGLLEAMAELCTETDPSQPWVLSHPWELSYHLLFSRV